MPPSRPDATVPDYFLTRAKVQEAKGARDNAIADFSKALELDPASKPAKGGLSRSAQSRRGQEKRDAKASPTKLLGYRHVLPAE